MSGLRDRRDTQRKWGRLYIQRTSEVLYRRVLVSLYAPRYSHVCIQNEPRFVVEAQMLGMRSTFIHSMSLPSLLHTRLQSFLILSDIPLDQSQCAGPSTLALVVIARLLSHPQRIVGVQEARHSHATKTSRHERTTVMCINPSEAVQDRTIGYTAEPCHKFQAGYYLSLKRSTFVRSQSRTRLGWLQIAVLPHCTVELASFDRTRPD